MTGKRGFIAVCVAMVVSALAAGPAVADESPELVLSASNPSMLAPIGASQDGLYYVANTSDAPVRIEGIDLKTGPASTGRFTLAGPSTCSVGDELPPQQTCTFTLRFSPLTVNQVFATLQVRGTKLSAPKPLSVTSSEVPVSGAGFTVSLGEAKDFGNVPVGLVGGATAVTLANTGPVGIPEVTVSGPDADDFFLVGNGCDHELDGPCDMRLRFAPSALGLRTATLTVRIGAAYAYAVPLSGHGVPLAPGPKGDKGDPGPQGAPGPAGQVTCRNTAAARLLCDALLAPGTWKTAARFTLSRHGRVYARGRAVIRHGRVKLRLSHARKLRRGSYLLKVRVGHRVVLRRTTRIR